MPEWLTFLLADTSALQLVFWIIAIGALIATIAKLWPTLTKVVTVVNAANGLPEFMERTDGTLADQSKRIGEIHHEVHYNNGTSVKDAMHRVELGVKGLYDRADESDRKLAEHVRYSEGWKHRLDQIDERTQPPKEKP